MLHSNTERLIDYWRERKREGLSPLRSTIEPGDLSGVLPQVFILGRTDPGRFTFRLAGGLVTELHGRDLRQISILALWSEPDRPRLATALEACRRSAEPVIAVAEARASRGVASIELSFAPLVAETAPVDRIIGLYQPLESLTPLQGLPAELRLRHIASAAERAAPPAIRLVAEDGRLIA
jgi:hypothetical protein